MLDFKISWIIYSAVALYSCSLLSISAEGPPRKLAIADHKRINFAQANQPTILRCPIEMTDYPTFVDWFRGNMSLYMEQGYELTGKGALKIKSVTKQHEGTYTCEGINGHGAVRVNITLIVDNPEIENANQTPTNPNSANRVHGSPPMIKKRASTHFVDDEGGQVIFHCTASGQPQPHLFWIKDGHLIQDAENDVSKGRAHSTLKLRGLKKSDAGVYKCIARNKYAEDHMDFTLQVTNPSSPPRIVALEPPNVTIKEGATAVFWCEVDSKPGLGLRVKWLKKVYKQDNESPLTNDITLFRSGSAYYRTLNFSDGISAIDGVYKSKLLIRNSGKEDSGTYVCLALNDKGFNSKNVTLTVIGTAKPVSSPSSYFTSGSISLVVVVTVAFVIVLSAIIIVSHLYCKGRSSNKNFHEPVINNIESGKMSQKALSDRKHMKKDFIPYSQVSDLHSASKLLYDSNCGYDHTEVQITKSLQSKSCVH